MSFLKFIDKEGADSFRSGNVRFGRLKEYMKIEKKQCSGRTDEMENKIYTKKYLTPQGIPVKFTIDANRQESNYALCLYHLDAQHSTDKIDKMFQFGDHVVIIEDEKEFHRRLKKSTEKNLLYYQDVIYYQDDSIKDELTIMGKLATKSLDHFSFAKRKEIFVYQNEYRYLIVDESIKEKQINIEIGSLEDIAFVLNESEFWDYFRKNKCKF